MSSLTDRSRRRTSLDPPGNVQSARLGLSKIGGRKTWLLGLGHCQLGPTYRLSAQLTVHCYSIDGSKNNYDIFRQPGKLLFRLLLRSPTELRI